VENPAQAEGRPLGTVAPKAAEPAGRPESPGLAADRLRSIVVALREAGDAPAGACMQLEQKLERQSLNLVVVGQFKRGKTSLVNALIGEELLPVGALPLTSIVTRLQHGAQLQIEVLYEDGRREDVKRERLADFVTESGNPGNARGVREVVVSHPSDLLEAGIRLVDTPGVGSVYLHNTEVARRYMPNADVVLFVLSVDQPASMAEIEYLKDSSEYAAKIFVVLNKADLLSEAELADATDFVRRSVADFLGGSLRLFAVSARSAMRGLREGRRDLWESSGFPAFREALSKFLRTDKSGALVASVARAVLRQLSQARLKRELELCSMLEPLDELQEKLRRFDARRQAIEASKNDLAALLGAERDRLLREVVEKDLAAFEGELVREVVRGVGNEFTRLREMPLRKIDAALGALAVELTRRGFDDWRAVEEQKVSAAFGEACTRLGARLEAEVDALLEFAAGLFRVSYSPVRGAALWPALDRLRYKFWDVPGSLQLLIAAAIFALPRSIGERIVLRRASDAAADLVRTQSGRVRYEFQRHLERGASQFQQEMARNSEALLQALDRAMRAGVKRRSAASEAAAAGQPAIEASLHRLEHCRLAVEALMTSDSDSAQPWDQRDSGRIAPASKISR